MKREDRELLDLAMRNLDAIGRARSSGRALAWDGEPCAKCGSPRHGTSGHSKLERLYQDWPAGWIYNGGQTGAPSPSMADMVRPDQVHIVRSAVSTTGGIYAETAISRVWRRDVWGGCTFMLSYPDDLITVERSCGVLGLDGAAGHRFSLMIPPSAPQGT